MKPSTFNPTLPPGEFKDRQLTLHRQLWTSDAFDFDAVMTGVYHAPDGYVMVDPQVVHDAAQWHLFYVTGRLTFHDEWIAALRANDFVRAREIPYEEGDGHAVGPTLRSLEYHSIILHDPQGPYGWGLQGDSAIVRYRDHWVNLFSARGPDGTSLCLARSDDLFTWRYETGNPVLWPPDWAMRPGKYGAAFIVPWQDRFLIYVQCISRQGLGAVQLLSTPNFETYQDHGPVFLMPLQWRGTLSVESPCVVYRDGIWHLFVTSGVGTWHSVSDRPDRFLVAPDTKQFTTAPGTYCLGPLHACRIFPDPETDDWYLIGTRKEEQRRINRQSGIATFRGTKEDEAALLAGLFLSRIRWSGDQPILEKITP